MIRLVIADDHSLIREGLRKVFSREEDIVLVAEASDAAGAVALVREHDIDVAILDLNMPGRSGLDAIAAIHALRPKLPVLILSMIQERDIAMRVFKAGGVGFVSKESAAEEIVLAVRQVAAGKKYVSAAVAEQLAEGIGTQVAGLPHDMLSNRELMVLRLIATGQGTRQMAEQLSLSVNTIATYRRRILEKLNVRSDVEITRYALQHKLCD